MRSLEDFQAVLRLFELGLNDCAIARQTGIPRLTVRDWRCRPRVRSRIASTSSCVVAHDFSGLAAKPYSYLLCMHLGDGCISRCRRVWHLRVTLDKKYPGIIAGCCAANSFVA